MIRLRSKHLARSLYESHRKVSRRYSSSPLLQSSSSSSVTLYDSLTESFKTVQLPSPSTTSENVESAPKGLAWYTCGPTVYDSAHLGHARTYVSLDIIQRAILYNHKMQSFKDINNPSPPPIFIMNVTDVDDKILSRAKENGVSPIALARKFEQEFWEDMEALNVMRPTIVTRVTDHVESSIIPYIGKIEENGMAYVIPDDGVYFDVRAFEAAKGQMNRYGKLASSRGNETLFSWENDNANDSGETRRKQQKKDPRDFVLWKSRGGAEEDLCWDSPWGKGRPGWHIECSAMIDSTMQQFDHYDMHVHAGGVDLKFPHHTNEIAQAEAYHHGGLDAKEWIPHWVHTGHLHINGLKMSKSLKNFITIRDILKTEEGITVSLLVDSPADDFRLWVLGLSGSYRGPATYSKSRLLEAKVTREKILRFLMDGEQWIKRSTSNDASHTSTWSSREHALVQLSSDCQGACQRALLGLNEKDTSANFDFDGSAYLWSIIDLSEAGIRYISDSKAGEYPTYPVERALSVLRECLSIVGFSDNTVRAGVSQHLDKNIHGDDEALIEEIVGFRKAIREAALARVKGGAKGSDEIEFSKNLLTLCDEFRDKNLPAIGMEIFDGDVTPSWRLCVPRTPISAQEDEAIADRSIERRQTIAADTGLEVTSSNFFLTGRYEGLFSTFDADGIPTYNSDGSEVSNRMKKKLLKKMQAFLGNKKA